MDLKQVKDLSKGEQKIAKILRLHGTQRILGTGSDKQMDYISDIDLQEYVNCKKSDKVYSEILKMFQKKYKEIEAIPNTFITDFKCGELAGGIPIRWNATTIQKGYQIIEDRRYDFTTCLKQESIIKMDIIAYLGGKFTEFSENYYLDIGGHKSYPEFNKNALADSLLRDFKKYVNQGKPFKALKRLYSSQKLTGKVNKILITFLNSRTGLLNKIKGDLEIVLDVMDKEVDMKIIMDAIGNILAESPEYLKQFTKNVSPASSKEDIGKEVKRLIEEIDKKVKDKTIQFLQKKNLLYKVEGV